jgi:hypothetical protein
MITQFPPLFLHYTYKTYTTENGCKVKTLGGVSELDQLALINLGWLKISDTEFILPKESHE